MLVMLLMCSAQAGLLPNLKLSGQGTAYYMKVFKVYDAQLHVGANATKANILEPNVSRCLRLNYAVDLTVDKFVLAANTVLQRQHSAAQLQRVKPLIDRVHNSYKDVKKGDIYVLCYDANTQLTRLELNDQLLVQVNSPEFAKVYFGLWLGAKAPLSAPLRASLLQGV